MRYPSHIILDIAKSSTTYSSQYWVLKYLTTFKNNPYSFEDLTFHRKFFFKKENLMPNKLMKNQARFTLRYNYTNPAVFMSTEQKNLYKVLFKTRTKVKRRLLFSKHYGKEVYDYITTNPALKFDEKAIRRLFRNFTYEGRTSLFRTQTLWNLFDIHFLRKEKMYTKLKYSRVPQYDIVSAGVSALFAAFLGFLITEKFGFELLDSGDFYYLFMYFVFVGFFFRLFLKLVTAYDSSWNVLSYKWLLHFYKTIVILFIRFIRGFVSNVIFKIR